MMVGRYGQLQEWLEDWDRETSGHRHVSHLWCAYPGRQVSPYTNPVAAAAVRKSLIGRGDASRGGEGSGLGLNIARSLSELQGGTFDIFVDGDLFRVDLTLPASA